MKRILIVDDEPVVRRLISLYLRGRFIIEEAEDGEKALTKAAGGGYDYVITDVNMPRMDGLSLLGEIKRLSPRTAVIVMSALGELYAAVAMERGAHTVISKPFVRDTLQTALQCA
jgi:YesN/AraC family two-component response regulator